MIRDRRVDGAFPKCEIRTEGRRKAHGLREMISHSLICTPLVLYTLSTHILCIYTLSPHTHTHTIQQIHHLLSTHSLHMQTLHTLLPTAPLPFPSLGRNRYLQLLADRKALVPYFKETLAAVAEKHGERMLDTSNPISSAMTVGTVVRLRLVLSL